MIKHKGYRALTYRTYEKLTNTAKMKPSTDIKGK
jgi:hypothetical protein